MRISQDVTEEPTVSLRILAVNDDMRSRNSHAYTVARPIRRTLNSDGPRCGHVGLVDRSLQATIGTCEQRHSNIRLSAGADDRRCSLGVTYWAASEGAEALHHRGMSGPFFTLGLRAAPRSSSAERGATRLRVSPIAAIRAPGTLQIQRSSAEPRLT
jgi:hypothetical protein